METCSLKAYYYDGDMTTSFDVPPNLKEGALGGPFEVGRFMVDHCPFARIWSYPLPEPGEPVRCLKGGSWPHRRDRQRH